MAINPDGIPRFAGDPDACEDHGQALIDVGDRIRAIGADTDRCWQELSSFYRAPEADTLFTAMVPVKTGASTIGDQVGTVGQALKDFAVEVRPLAGKLTSLRADARTFVASVQDEGDDAWKKQDNVDENNRLVRDVDATVIALQAAERRCANRIGALYCRQEWVVDDGSGDPNAYGTDAIPDNAERPWGNPEEKRPDGFLEHVGNFFKGFFVEGLWGDLKGLFHMVAFWTPEFKETWSGLWFLVSGWTSDVGAWGEAWKGVGKSLIAWDAWASGDWGTASGTVLYNALTFFVAPAKIATLAKSGKLGAGMARVATVVSKLDIGRIGRLVIDGLPTVRTLVSHLDDLKISLASKMDDFVAKLPGMQVVLPGVGALDLNDLNRTLDLDSTDMSHHNDGTHDVDGSAHTDGGAGDTTGDGSHRDGANDGTKDDGGNPDGSPKPNTPSNDPSWDKTDPSDRAKIREQVAHIRQEIGSRLTDFAEQAWKKVDDKWDELKETKFARALGKENPAPEHLLKGAEVGREFDRLLKADMDNLIDPNSGYRIRTEVSFDVDGFETSWSERGSKRPDIILERQRADGIWEVVHVWDLKTGGDLIGKSWADEVMTRTDPVFTPETINPHLPAEKIPVPQAR